MLWDGSTERLRSQLIKAGSSLQLVALKTHQVEAPIEDVLLWMSCKGSSVLLSWGEDTQAWECSWITGGERFTGVHGSMRLAVLASLNKAFTRAVELNPTGANQ
jgi:hypothetical protein